MHDAINFDEYTQVLAGDTTNKMTFLGGEKGASLCIANNNYTCCAKMAGKEETPTCRKKTVTWTNEMIEDLIDFIEIHPIVAFEAIILMNTHKFWGEIQQTKWHFWEERRELPFVLHYYVQLYCEGD
jgi:hypothetical protein